MSSVLPPNFMDLNTACSRLNSEVNVMGVVTDFLSPGRSHGTDWMCTFSIKDPSYPGDNDQGVKVRFFKPMESEMPAIQGIGDVVLIKFLKIKEWHGMTMGLASFKTSWVVFPAASIPANPSSTSLQLQHAKQPSTPTPTASEMRYAITLHDSCDCNSFTEPISAPISDSITPLPNGAVSASRGWRDKFSLVKDVVCETYYDLVGQVVKLYPHSDRVELYLTDYTSNNLLWNYEWGQDDKDGSGREGDVYNYIARNSPNQKWPGPFGKMTLTVTLWPPHGRQNVKETDWVFLRNVHIKWSKDAKLEGVLHSDKRNPGRIDVNVLKNIENDDRVKDVLRRKRDYQKIFQISSEDFVAEARGIKRKVMDSAKPLSKTAQKKARKKDRALLAKSKDQDELRFDGKENSATPGITDYSPDLVTKALKQGLNRNVNCSNHLVAPRSLSSIVSFATYANTTPNGTSYTLPFQNINSRAIVRIVDFFPSQLADFAMPCSPPSEYACLSDAGDSLCESDSERESQISDAESQSQRDGRQWEWRFGLVLEDAVGSNSEERESMKVYVAGADAECLLKLDAVNLRKSPKALAELREKLFLMWGDLEEQKGRRSTTLQPIGGNARHLEKEEVPKSKAFHCCLKEYGVKKKIHGSVEREDIGNESSQAEEDNGWGWERRWRMFGTTIV